VLALGGNHLTIRPYFFAAFVPFLLALSPAHALSNRAWVSGHGSDSAGCGSPGAPCRTLQYVHDNVIAAGGEIDILDPAGYGAVTISKAVSIVNDGVGAAGVQAASGNAITINAGASDVVTLRGLDIDGLGTGDNGIVFNSGAGLTVVNCVVRHFAGGGQTTGNGILIQPSGAIGFLISNVVASDNGWTGIYYGPPSGSSARAGVIDRVTAVNNSKGIWVAPLSGAATVALSNSVMNNNGVGIEATPGSTVSIDSSTMSNNDIGLDAYGSAIVLLGRSAITANNAGIQNTANTVYTYGDNRINGNSTDIANALNTTDKPQ